MKQKITALTFAGLLTGAVGGHAADNAAAPKPAPVLTAADRKTAQEQYLIPSPGDILDALHHSARIDWRGLSTQIEKSDAETKNSYADDSQKALNLGMRVADAFVAVEAKDAAQFERSSSAVEKLGQELSLDTKLSDTREAAKKLVDADKWTELSNLLEKVRADFLHGFQAVPDEDSVILANVGGWLRGLDLVTGALSKNYTPDATRLLRQSELIAYLDARLQKLEVPATNQAVAAIKAKLPEITALCAFDETTTLPQDKVQRLHEITSELVHAVQK